MYLNEFQAIHKIKTLPLEETIFKTGKGKESNMYTTFPIGIIPQVSQIVCDGKFLS